MTTKTTRESVWKKIEGYQDKYSVSSLGEVRNDKTKKILRPCFSFGNYLQVNLWDNTKKKGCNAKLHRLVATYFLPRDVERPYVNHKDGIKENNTVTNLEWCTSRENARHSMRLGIFTPKKGIEVGQFTLGGKLVAKFLSLTEAGKKLHCCRHDISECLKGLRETVAGYKWKMLKDKTK